MSLDFKAMADAIATRFTSTYVTAPSGATNIRDATASLPFQLKAFPIVLVMPPGEGDVDLHVTNSLRHGTITFPVRFYLQRIQSEDRNAALVLNWLTSLYANLDSKIQLGLSYVSQALILDVAAATLSYGGETYEGIVLNVVVTVTDTMNPTA